MGLDCPLVGGCPSDYVAVSIAGLAMITVLVRASFPVMVCNAQRMETNTLAPLIIQILASFNLLFSIVLSMNYLRFKRRYSWRSCYVWAVWVEGPGGFGLLLSYRIMQAHELYYMFVRRRFPPIKAYIMLPLLLFPWIGAATFINIMRPMTDQCRMGIQWVIPVVGLHMLYVIVLIGITSTVRTVEFRFDEFRKLLLGIIASGVCVGTWLSTYIINEINENNPWLPVASRFFLLLMASVLVVAFFSVSISQPMLSQLSLRRRVNHEFDTMGRALGISDRVLLQPIGNGSVVQLNDPLDKLLMNKEFRNSFMAFADSCMAGEGVHFYDEVYELTKIPVDDTVRRIYMARHIIEQYILAGSVMEVNISHRTRQEILNTPDLSHADLFGRAVTELTQLMKMNLEREYWSSVYFLKFKEAVKRQAEANLMSEGVMHLDSSPRASSVHGADNPFHPHSLSGLPP